MGIPDTHARQCSVVQASQVAECNNSNVSGGLAEAAHPMVLAMSVQCGEERASAGAVVKPTWLLMIKWIVPPVEKPAITEMKYACAAPIAFADNICLSGKSAWVDEHHMSKA